MPGIHYADGPAGALEYFKLHRSEMRTLRKIIVGPDGTRIRDINGDEMVLSGLTLGNPDLDALLKLSGASYNPATLHDPPAGRSPDKEFEVVRSDPWGQDRDL